MSDLASSNDVTKNGVNGRIGNKTWCKCECCAPMETSIEGFCSLDITEIWNRRFISRFLSCLNVCRSDTQFVLWYSWRENFVSYLISIQCWYLANQNKSFLSLQAPWFSFSVKHFTLLRILTGKKHSKVKIQRLRKIRIWTFASLVHQINPF